MNSFKSILAVSLTVISFSLQAMINFDLVNSFPAVPVYYKINNEPNWHVLDKSGYRISRNVPDNGRINVALSAQQDGSNPTRFTFGPHGTPITCYIQASVNFPSRRVTIAPQNPSPTNRARTRYGLLLNHNITPDGLALCEHCAQTESRESTEETPAPKAAPLSTEIVKRAALGRDMIVEGTQTPPGQTTPNLALALRNRLTNGHLSVVSASAGLSTEQASRVLEEAFRLGDALMVECRAVPGMPMNIPSVVEAVRDGRMPVVVCLDSRPRAESTAPIGQRTVEQIQTSGRPAIQGMSEYPEARCLSASTSPSISDGDTSDDESDSNKSTDEKTAAPAGNNQSAPAAAQPAQPAAPEAVSAENQAPQRTPVDGAKQKGQLLIAKDVDDFFKLLNDAAVRLNSPYKRSLLYKSLGKQDATALRNIVHDDAQNDLIGLVWNGINNQPTTVTHQDRCLIMNHIEGLFREKRTDSATSVLQSTDSPAELEQKWVRYVAQNQNIQDIWNRLEPVQLDYYLRLISFYAQYLA